MSRIGLSQTVLPNRISCLCVESIRRIRRTPVFGVRGAASARSALSFRCKQVCLDSFFTRNTFVAGFFLSFFSALSSDPGRPSPSSHFVSFDSLRPRRKSAYLYLQDPAYAKRPQRRGKPEKRLDFRCFLPKKTHETMTIVKLYGRVYTYSTHFPPPAPVFGPGFRPEQPPGPDRLPPFFIAGGCARTSVSPSQDHARPCGVVGGRSEGTNRSTSRVRARK